MKMENTEILAIYGTNYKEMTKKNSKRKPNWQREFRQKNAESV